MISCLAEYSMFCYEKANADWLVLVTCLQHSKDAICEWPLKHSLPHMLLYAFLYPSFEGPSNYADISCPK